MHSVLPAGIVNEPPPFQPSFISVVPGMTWIVVAYGSSAAATVSSLYCGSAGHGTTLTSSLGPVAAGGCAGGFVGGLGGAGCAYAARAAHSATRIGRTRFMFVLRAGDA